MNDLAVVYLTMFSRNIARYFCNAKVPIDKTKNVQTLLNEAATFQDVYPVNEEDKWSTLPYPESARISRDQSLKASRPKIDPKETSIILFPGQGVQYVGMNKKLLQIPSAKDIFDFANEILG